MTHFDRSQYTVFYSRFLNENLRWYRRKHGQSQELNAKCVISSSTYNAKMEYITYCRHQQIQWYKEYSSLLPPSLLTSLKNILTKFIPYMTLLKDMLHESSVFNLSRQLEAKSTLLNLLLFINVYN